MTTRVTMFNRQRTLPVQWFDLVTFDREWIKDKKIKYKLYPDGVMKPVVYDSTGKVVWPVNE